MKRFIFILFILSVFFPSGAYTAEQEELEKKIQDLNMQLEELKKEMGNMKTQEMFQDKRMQSVEEKANTVEDKFSWLTIGGEYRFRIDSLKGDVHDYMQYNTSGFFEVPMQGMTTVFLAEPTEGYETENESVMFNRFRLKVNARVYKNLSLYSRLSMYKVWGHDSMKPVDGNFFADRAMEEMGPFDGVMGYVPQDSILRVDYAFASWKDIFDTPLWFSIGRRYSTQGVPTNIRQNTEKFGTAGVAGHLIDYAFDGLTIGYEPEIKALPGAYAKFCYGRGFDSGFNDAPGSPDIKDTDFVGFFIDPYYTDNLNIELQFLKAYNIFNTLPDSGVTANLGDIDNYGMYISGRLKNVGIGNLNLFVSGAFSKTHPNSSLYELPFFGVDMNDNGVLEENEGRNGGFGLLYDDSDPMTPGGQGGESKTGESVYLGARYDITKTGTKIGFEYNYGSKNWISFTPAADDLWTSKLGTRGSVYEGYLIQKLPGTPVAKFGNAFVRVGYQYYQFDYTGSNNWIGEPKKIDDLNTSDPSGTQMFVPLENAQDIYATLDITF